MPSVGVYLDTLTTQTSEIHRVQQGMWLLGISCLSFLTFSSEACGPVESAFEYDSLSPNSTIYQYCALIPGAFIPKCSSCLALQTSEYYLKNCKFFLPLTPCSRANHYQVFTVLNGACDQQPTPGKTVSLQGSLFSTTQVNITSPSATPLSTYTPSNGLSLGDKVGVAVGALLALVVTTGFCIVWNGRRRRRKALAKHQQESGYATWLAEQQAINRNPAPSLAMRGGDVSAGGFHDSPQSQRPLFPGPSWGVYPRDDESPASGVGEKTYFSPYSSQYSSPVSAHDQVQVVTREWPTERKGSIGAPSSGLTRSRSMDKRWQEQDGDRIEMQNVPPVLLHPGNGRNHHAGLTEENVMQGQPF